MKKNVMLKIAAVVMVAVLLSTCAISATFAKYVSDGGEYEASARVAKWGIVTTTAFDDCESGFAVEYGTNGKHVKSNNTDELLAPGTSGTMKFVYTVTGEAEVSGQVLFTDANGAKTDFIQVANSDLASALKWYDADGNALANLAAVNKYIADNLVVTFEPGQTLNATDTVEVSWEWPFEANRNDLDTDLGEAGSDTIVIDINASVEQTGPAQPRA